MTMATENKSQQTIYGLCKKLKNAYYEVQAEQLVKITNEIEQVIREGKGTNSDSTDSAFDILLSDIVESVEDDFIKLIDADSKKSL